MICRHDIHHACSPRFTPLRRHNYFAIILPLFDARVRAYARSAGKMFATCRRHYYFSAIALLPPAQRLMPAFIYIFIKCEHSAAEKEQRRDAARALLFSRAYFTLERVEECYMRRAQKHARMHKKDTRAAPVQCKAKR